MLIGTLVVFTDDPQRWAISSVHWQQRGRAPHGNCVTRPVGTSVYARKCAATQRLNPTVCVYVAWLQSTLEEG